MLDVRWCMLVAAAAALFTLVSCSPRIAHSQYVYRYSEEGEICIYASFVMSFTIYYNHTDLSSSDGPSYKKLYLPNKTMVNISGKCAPGASQSQMTLHWEGDNSLQMTFGTAHGKWELQQIQLTFNMSAVEFDLTEDRGLQTFLTNGTDLFSRTFKTDEYFYCKNCKTYEFSRYNETACEGECQMPCILFKNKTKYCSSVHMEKSVIYIGDPSKANKRLCLEDYIALQEIIVPSVVGGVLGLLLLLIFFAYIIAYLRRRRREAKSQYEPVEDF